MKTLIASFVCLAALAVQAAPPPPANDNFADRIAIVASGSVTVSGVNAKATSEAGDPTIEGDVAYKSVWWSWTAPFNGPATITTHGSSFDTLLGIFTGSALASLVSVAENDDANGLYTSSVVFNAVGGVPYAILVGGFNGAGGKIKLNVQVSAGGPCSYSLNPSSRSVVYTAGSSSVAVTTTTGCTWSAVSNDSWLTITAGSSGSGSGTVTYSIAANTLLTSRTGTLTVAGLTHTVTQAPAPGCTYSLSPTSASVVDDGATNTIAMTAGTGCAWNAVPSASWITIPSGSSGTGNGTITYVVATNSVSTARNGVITAGGQTFSISQEGTVACTYAISPTTAPFTASGGTSNIVVSTQTACAWTAYSPATWVTFSTTNGTGNATVTYTVAVNSVTQARSAVLTVAENSFTVTQSAAACSYSLTPTSVTAPHAGLSSTVSVTTTTGCSWTAVANQTWLTITAGTSGSGSGTVSFTAAANLNTAARSGTLTIGGQTFTVNQDAAPCIYSITPTSVHFTEALQTGSIAVTAGTGCAWTAVANDVWITINSGTPGSGNGTVGYTVGANATASSRTGTITVAGSTFTITQDGTAPCSYGISPSGVSVAAAGTTNTVAVTSNTGCTWSVSSGAFWITFTPASGSGNGTVTYMVAANTSSIARSGSLTIAGQPFTVNQSGATCTFTLSPSTASYTYVGGSGTATVTATAGCNWTSVSDSSWLTISSGASGTGNGSVSYSVAASTATTNRTGRLTIATRVLTVTQTAAPCTSSISPVSASIGATGGVGTIEITESDVSCAWTATDNQTWITVTPASGTGSGSIDYTVAPTVQSTSRTGTITVAGKTFTITQAGDTTAPTVTLTSPANGSTVSNVINLTATATDNLSIARVDFYRGAGVLLGTDSTTPYSVPFNTTNVANGSYTFYARGFDTANNEGSSATNTVTITNPSTVNTNQWAQRFGGTGSDLGRATAVDSSGNIYMAGSYTGTASFGGSSLTNAGSFDIFIAKYTSAGAHVWSKRYGSTANETVNAMAVDSSGNVFIGGSFSGTANFGGTNSISAGNIDGFVAEYDSSGNFIWSRAFGSSAVDVVNSLDNDSAGNVIAAGTFQGTVAFGGTPLNSVDGSTDIFLAKYSNTGAHTFSKSFTNVGTDVARGVAVDSGNNILLTGYFTASINFGGGNLVSSDQIFGGPEVFIAKFNSAGTYTWANRYGMDETERAFAIAVAPNDDVAIVGDFIPYTNLGGLQFSVGNSTVSDLFVMKAAGSNGAHQWSQKFGGASLEAPYAIAFDASSNVFITGSFNGSATFGTTTLTSVGAEDVFVVKYTSAGVFSVARSFGSTGTDVGYGIAVDANGYQSVSGTFSGTANFNGTSLTSVGGFDAFLVRQSP